MQKPSYLSLFFLTLSSLLFLISSTSYPYSPCSSTHYLNPSSLSCTSCLSNQHSNTYQTVPISCQCLPGYQQSIDNLACTAVFSSNCNISNSYYPVVNKDGSINSGTGNDCVACNGEAKSNGNQTGCVRCGTGMIYDSGTGNCICSNSNYVKTQFGCFGSTITPSIVNTQYTEQLKYLITACQTHKDLLSCSQIVNLCTYSQGDPTTPECQFFTTYALTSYLVASSSAFSLTASQSSNLSMKIVTFAATGNYIKEKTLYLSDLLRCGTPQDSQIGITFGTNIEVQCQFDFNNLLKQMDGKKYQNKVYQLLIKSDDSKYYDVPVYMSRASTPIRRFFTQDTYTYSNKINVLTSLTFELTFKDGKLVEPRLTPRYTLLSTQVGTGIVGTSLFQLQFNVLFSCDLSTYWTGAIASFIVVSVVALIHTIAKTYIGYLNRKSAVQFLTNFTGIYSLWLFYYLLFMTGYWFLFTKTTSSPFLLLSRGNPTLYSIFYALVAIMVFFRLIWALRQKSDKLDTQVYLINWEKGQFRNSWRQIFIVNSLAEFYTYRTFSLFWMLAVLMFFMNGIGWESLAASTASTGTTYETLTSKNRIYMYFLGAAIFLAVGIIFKLIRRLSVLFWPYPFEDFVDYCTVTNISFVFIKRRAPHAYYLHAALPDRTDVSYREINESIRRGLQKNRSVANQISSLDSLRLYSIYLSKDIEDRHTQLLKKLEDQEHASRVKYSKDLQKRRKINLREEFIETRLKPHIESMVTRQNDERRKTLLQSYCGFPPLDLRQQGGRNRSTVFYDQNVELVNEVFPNGDQFEDIHTMIVIFLGWLTLVNSVPIAAFLTYFVDEFLINGWISWSCRNSLQEMTKVKKGFMI